MLTRSLFRLFRNTTKFGASGTETKKPAQKTVSSIKSIPKKEKKPKNDSNSFPEELKKAGISPKSFDANMMEMYKKMKAQGADEYAKKQIDEMFKNEEKPSDYFESILKKPESKVNTDYKSLFPGKQKFSRMYQDEELPAEVQDRIGKEMRQFDEQEKFYKEKDLEFQKKKDFKAVVKNDSQKTEDKIENKEFGWMDKIKIEDPKSEEFLKMVKSWPKFQQDYFTKLEDKDDRKLYKENKKLEKIKNLRKIRDDYKDFKIGLVSEVTDDIHQKRSKQFLLTTIENILNDSSQKIQSTVLQSAFLNVQDLIITKSISVIHVFFTLTFINKVNNEFEKTKAQHEEVRRKLVHAAPFLRSRITQSAGLKYAPELRFYAYNPVCSPRQVLDGLEDDTEFWDEVDNKSQLELEDIVKAKLPGKYMKKAYYSETGKLKKMERDRKKKK